VYWTRLNNEVEQYVWICKTYDRFKNANLKEKCIVYKQPSLQFEILSTDILTYGEINYVVIFDHYSKWLKIINIKIEITGKIVDKFKRIFCNMDIQHYNC